MADEPEKHEPQMVGSSTATDEGCGIRRGRCLPGVTEYEECSHGLIPEICSLCKHPFKPPEPERVVYSMIAKYPGTCPKCHSLIIEGDIIAHLLPSDRWVCEDCARCRSAAASVTGSGTA